MSPSVIMAVVAFLSKSDVKDEKLRAIRRLLNFLWPESSVFKTTSRSARNRFVRTRSALTRERSLQFRSEFRDQHCSRHLASKRCTLPGPLSAESRLTRGLRGSVQRLACIVCEWIVRNRSAFDFSPKGRELVCEAASRPT